MKKILFIGLLLSTQSFIQSEDVLIKGKKAKSESVSKMKEQLAIDLESLLKLATEAMKHVAEFINDIVVDVKQLTGQESGALASADKKTLESYRAYIEQSKASLKNLEKDCCLRA